MLFARTCPLCRRPGPAPCASCAARLRPAPPAPPLDGLDRVAALVAYEGAGATLVRRLKYANHRDGLARLAAAMAILVEPGAPDLVTWVPTTAARRRHRGYDQGRLLGRSVAVALGCPARGILRRTDRGSQTARRGADRRRGPALAVRRPVQGTVLVVDDVRTTGASLEVAAAALRRAGAASVVAVTLAATPERTPAGSSTIL